MGKKMADFMRVEDLKVYQKLCQLHLEVCDLASNWPKEEKYELAGQDRRSSNSARLISRKNIVIDIFEIKSRGLIVLVAKHWKLFTTFTSPN